MTVITPEFIEREIQAGPLARAHGRSRDGTARPPNKAQWDKFSTWSLICEEILDTEHDDWWYDDIMGELARRGVTFEQMNAMRRFAWKTVGWLNYDKALWEWGGLDEKDMERALDWQLRDGVITREQYDKSLQFVQDPAITP